MEMNLQLLKGSKLASRWQDLAKPLGQMAGMLRAGVEQVFPKKVSEAEWKTALLAQMLVLALWTVDYCIDIHFHFAILYFIPITYAARAGGVTPA